MVEKTRECLCFFDDLKSFEFARAMQVYFNSFITEPKQATTDLLESYLFVQFLSVGNTSPSDEST